MLFDLLDLHFFAKTKVYFPESSWSKPTEKITSRCTARKFNCFLTEGIFWPSILPVLVGTYLRRETFRKSIAPRPYPDRYHNPVGSPKLQNQFRSIECFGSNVICSM